MFKKKLLLIFIPITFIASFFIFKHYFSIFYFQNDVGKIAINIESENIGEINVCFDKNCDKMEYLKGVYSYELNQQNPLFYNNSPLNIEFIASTKKLAKYASAISIFYNLKDVLYLSRAQIDEISPSEVEFQGIKKYSYEIMFNKASNKTLLQKLGVYFEGIFYNWYFYFISYCLVILYFCFYKDRFDFKIKHPIFLILLLAFLLRISHIDYIPLWNDELYTCCFISDLGKKIALDRVFLDPGNPPLFFIISNFWLLFFNKTIFSIRMLPCLIGVLQVYSAYFVAKRIFNKKVALISAFLSSINILLILESNEIRSYILSMVLILWALYWFYKLKNNFNNRSLIIFSLITILLVNIHYYCLFYVLFNFVLGIFLFKNNRKKYILANCICFLTFLPYLFATFLKTSLDKNFNTWIEKPSIEMIHNHIVFYFGNIFYLILIIVFCFFVYKKFQQKEKDIFLYNIFSIAFVFIVAFLISILIKPVLFERYFIIFFPFLILNTALILNIDYKTKCKPLILCLVLLFSINAPKYENFNLFSNISLMAKYSYLDSKANEKVYKTYYIIPDIIEYIKYFPNINKEKVIISKYGMLDDEFVVEKILNEIDDKKSKKILYFPESTFNFLLRNSKKLKVIKIETTLMRVYKVYIN